MDEELVGRPVREGQVDDEAPFDDGNEVGEDELGGLYGGELRLVELQGDLAVALDNRPARGVLDPDVQDEAAVWKPSVFRTVLRTSGIRE